MLPATIAPGVPSVIGGAAFPAASLAMMLYVILPSVSVDIIVYTQVKIVAAFMHATVPFVLPTTTTPPDITVIFIEAASADISVTLRDSPGIISSVASLPLALLMSRFHY